MPNVSTSDAGRGRRSGDTTGQDRHAGADPACASTTGQADPNSDSSTTSRGRRARELRAAGELGERDERISIGCGSAANGSVWPSLAGQHHRGPGDPVGCNTRTWVLHAHLRLPSPASPGQTKVVLSAVGRDDADVYPPRSQVQNRTRDRRRAAHSVRCRSPRRDQRSIPRERAELSDPPTCASLIPLPSL
jgi:hypothetical protein